MTSDTARAVLDHGAERITQLPLITPRVAIDGRDGAGKPLSPIASPIWCGTT